MDRKHWACDVKYAVPWRCSFLDIAFFVYKEDFNMANRERFESLLFSEFRCVVSDANKDVKLTNQALAKAMTLNTNLESLGYTFLPLDLVETIALDDKIGDLYDKINSFVPEVSAPPMYPNFPTQVMNMDAAQYRMHQAMHYASTYGVEYYGKLSAALFGGDPGEVEVKRGWLPDMPSTEKDQEDTTLLPLKTLEVISEKEMFKKPFQQILSKRERMTDKDKEIISLILELDGKNVINYMPEQIPFKENLTSLTSMVLSMEDKDQAKNVMTKICQHTGDVIKCLENELKAKHYHLKRPEKRLWVQLLESYPSVDLASNLMLSNKRASKHIADLQYINYNEYSKSAEHKEVVRAFRNGELRSWEGKLKSILSKDLNEGLQFAAQRPGNLLRMTTWFSRMGVSDEELINALSESADKLSTQTLVDVINKTGNEWAAEYENGRDTGHISYERDTEQKETAKILKEVLKTKLATIETPLGMKVKDGDTSRDRKVYLEEANYSFKDSKVVGNEKSEEGGYLKKGLAIRIPENVQNIRMFTYWNDKHRVDIDLHTYMYDKDGNTFHVGWNGDFKDKGVVMSGDITHSDAAEYIDINLKDAAKAGLRRVDAQIDVFSGPNFKGIDTSFAGLLAVDKLGERVKLYNPKNCIVAHDLTSDNRTLNYGTIYPEKRVLELDATSREKVGNSQRLSIEHETVYSLQDYLEGLVTAQGAVLVDSKEEADTVLRIEKAEDEKEISLMDSNFFMDKATNDKLCKEYEEKEADKEKDSELEK